MFRAPLAVILAGALAATLGAFSTLRACSCTGERTLQQEFMSAAAVFSGRVTSFQPAGDGINVIVTVTPLHRWKGGLDASVAIATGANDGLCGVAFEVGREYLVFAWPYTGQAALFTHLCSRTARVEGNPDIQNLGSPLTPTPARAKSWGAVKRAWR